jgi:hypothetical protein
MARRSPIRRLKSVDLPTLGRPTMATRDGFVEEGVCKIVHKILRFIVQREPKCRGDGSQIKLSGVRRPVGALHLGLDNRAVTSHRTPKTAGIY